MIEQQGNGTQLTVDDLLAIIGRMTVEAQVRDAQVRQLQERFAAAVRRVDELEMRAAPAVVEAAAVEARS